jgi:hypothetical protein
MSCERCAVLPHCHQFECLSDSGPFPATAEVSQTIASRFVAFGGGEQRVQVLSHGFRNGPSEHGLCRAVIEGDMSRRIHHHDGVLGAVGHGDESLFRPTQLFLRAPAFGDLRLQFIVSLGQFRGAFVDLGFQMVMRLLQLSGHVIECIRQPAEFIISGCIDVGVEVPCADLLHAGQHTP